MNIIDLLKGKLSKKDINKIPRSFDVVGNILIFNKPFNLGKKKEKILGETILNTFHNIRTICIKTKKYAGKYRTPTLKIMYGEKTKETVHRENFCVFKLDVEKCYFSTRSGTERLRIVNKISIDKGKNKKVLVMFSGIGAFPIEIKKLTKKGKVKEVYGVEINPIAHKYALENLKLNKLSVEKGNKNKKIKKVNIELIKGDVKKVKLPSGIKFDYILMPLPKEAEKFLDIALKYSKKNTKIFLYLFLSESEYEKTKEKIEKKYNENKNENNYDKNNKNNKIEKTKTRKKIKVVSFTKAGQYAKDVYRVCIELVIT